MTVEAPKWLQSDNIIKVADPEHELRPESALLALKSDAPDEEKANFEKEMTSFIRKFAKVVFPEMKNPYYKWTGEVVDGKSRQDSVDKFRKRRQMRMDIIAYRKRRKSRLDAKEEGRWVTTENDNRVHINEEGVPDKGNPYVLKAMTSGTKTREEVGMSKIQKRRTKIKKSSDAYNAEDKAVDECAGKYYKIWEEYNRAYRHVETVDNIYMKALEQAGIGEKDGDKLRKEVEELEKKHKEDPHNREIESEYNSKRFLLAEYNECFGEETKEARKKAESLKREVDKAKKELDKHVSDRKKSLEEMRKSMDRDVQTQKFYSAEEREKIKHDFINGNGLSKLTDEDKAKIAETIDSASDAQLSVLQNSMKNARIMAVEDTANPGMSSHYHPMNGIIYLERDDMSNPRVFWHEYGHYMDDFKHSGLEYNVVTRGEGSAYEGKAQTFTDILESEVKVFGKDGVEDVQAMFDKVAPGKFEVKTNDREDYLSVVDPKTGLMIDYDHGPSFELQTAFDSIIDSWINGGPDGGELHEYYKSIGYPEESERPKREDYIETYVTPKRKIEREREKFKGAEEQWYQKMREYSEKQDAVRDAHPEFHDRVKGIYEKRGKREKLVAPVSDCLCAIMRGQVFSIYGCHDREYYRQSDKALNEWAANIHQMMFTQDKEAIDFLSEVMPKTMKKVKRSYNEYLWRNLAE